MPFATRRDADFPGCRASFRWVGTVPPLRPTTPASLILDRRSAREIPSHAQGGTRASRAPEPAAQLDDHCLRGQAAGKTDLTDLHHRPGDGGMDVRRLRTVSGADQHPLLHRVAGLHDASGGVADVLVERDDGERRHRGIHYADRTGNETVIRRIHTAARNGFFACVMGPDSAVPPH